MAFNQPFIRALVSLVRVKGSICMQMACRKSFLPSFSQAPDSRMLVELDAP